MKQDAVNSEAATPLERGWLAANEEVLRLGIEWIGHRLAGDDCTEARDAYDEARESLRAEGTPAAIDRLASRFRLAPFDEDVLLIVLAPEIDGSLGPRYGAAQGRLTPSPATPYLVALLLFEGDRLPSAAQVRLARSAILRRYELVSLDEAADLPMGASITLPERVRDYLCGIESADPLLEQRVRVLEGVPLNDGLDLLASKAAGLLSRSKRVQLIGPARSGRRAVAVAAFDRLATGCRKRRETWLSAFHTRRIRAQSRIRHWGRAAPVPRSRPCFEHPLRRHGGALFQGHRSLLRPQRPRPREGGSALPYRRSLACAEAPAEVPLRSVLQDQHRSAFRPRIRR